MDTIVETIEDAINQDSEAETQPSTTRPDDANIETQLTQEIAALWSSHVRLSGDRKATAKELRLVRTRLAERLHEIKCLLSRPGRSGQWRGWLRQQGIPRSTADRLASRHAETLCNHEENAPSEAIPEPTQADAQRLFESVLPRLKQKVTTPRLAFEFLLWFVGSSHLAHEWQEKGLLVLKPSVETAKESSGGVAAPAQAEVAVAFAGASDGDALYPRSGGEWTNVDGNP